MLFLPCQHLTGTQVDKARNRSRDGVVHQLDAPDKGVAKPRRSSEGT